MYDEAKGTTVVDKAPGALDCCTFFDVLQYPGSPDSKPTMSSLQPASFIALRVS
jgi:hypothetical protein